VLDGFHFECGLTPIDCAPQGLCDRPSLSSPTWRIFLATHARDIVAVDFFLVPTLTFRLLFVFVVLRHERRELLHINVTDYPSAVWTAQQIIEAFPGRFGSEIPASWSRRDLRRGVRAASQEDGDPRNPQSATATPGIT
jgi:hypothetical protein